MEEQDILRIANLIYREAIGFPTEEAYDLYMKQHPKADPKNHWVERDYSQKKLPETKRPDIYKVPEEIGEKGKEKIQIRNSLLRGTVPNDDGSFTWYDFNGKPVKDKDVLWRAERLAKELSVLNPKLTGVRVFTDHRAGSVKPFAMVYSDKWTVQKKASPFKYYYTEIQDKTANDRIMQKNLKFSKVLDIKLPEIYKDSEAGVPEAVVLRLIDMHHIRVGTKGQKNDGICTMKTKYAKVVNNKVVITDMPCKSDKKYSGVITDPVLVKAFSQRLKGKKPDDLVFGDTNDSRVNSYIKSKMGDRSFSTKNFRTCEATGIAMKVVYEALKGEDGKKKQLTLPERYEVMKNACVQASLALNNNPDVCHSNYIDNRVFAVLNLPDNDYHASYPIDSYDAKTGAYTMTWEAKIDKIESKFRQNMDDDKRNLWDSYSEARDTYLQRLNSDRRLDGWKEDLKRLPEIHAKEFIKRFLKGVAKK